MNLQVKIGEQSFAVEVGDLSARPIRVQVDDETFEVWPEEAAAVEAIPAAAPVSAPAAAVPAPAANGHGLRLVCAPIPGVIDSIVVKPGDKIATGQELCVLEAMKMKNTIRATREGSIAAVRVSVGDHVQKGHPLVEFTD